MKTPLSICTLTYMHAQKHITTTTITTTTTTITIISTINLLGVTSKKINMLCKLEANVFDRSADVLTSFHRQGNWSSHHWHFRSLWRVAQSQHSARSSYSWNREHRVHVSNFWPLNLNKQKLNDVEHTLDSDFTGIEQMSAILQGRQLSHFCSPRIVLSLKTSPLDLW